ncbi:hypothetical protein CH330_02175 [candidate division WOR-3 bacterium JGI_Cruoil_03_51_56]|uniref:Helix-hairpin-helix DNA-binding motif class 1 domain-containing protein n=1 Tax=candidate division WOR-3 bacterium JGI_Cruoil_03_51_56 TaxID=1973747 RepID=A0A235BWL4_UNCW3|nr:MAG: hypothetical protein CH330_02175 [candidate division WOR-3 bacterium JGI_Cruoil_03_51_56]
MPGINSYIGFMQLLILLGLFLATPSDFQVVRILATSDLHCRMRPSADFDSPGLPRRELGGWENLTKLIDDKRTDASILLDCGDFAFGSPEGRSTQGKATVRFMNLLSYDAVSIGARDFAGGAENLEILAKMAKFPFLADPMLDVVLNRRTPLFRPYVVKQVKGIKVAIIGLTDQEIPLLNRKDDTRGLVVDEPMMQIRHYLPVVKAESADIIIVIGHMRPQDGILLDSFPEINLLLYPAQMDSGISVKRFMPVGSYGQRLELIDMLFNKTEHRVYQVEARSLNVLPGRVDSSKIKDLIDEVTVDSMDKKACFSAVELVPYGSEKIEFGNMLAEAVRQSRGADIVLLETNVVESGLSEGRLKRRELFNAVPFAEPLRSVFMDDTILHKFLGALGNNEPAPFLAGADYFVFGDTSTWPSVGQIAKVRFRIRKARYRVVTTEQTLERSPLRDKGKLISENLTDLWVEWASAQDTLRPSLNVKLYPATPGLVRSENSYGPININTATASLFEELPGIGPKTAQRIIEYRQAHGRFSSVDELQNVKGIGPKKLEKIRPLATVR